MRLKLLLVKDSEVLCEIPLFMESWQKGRLEDELDALENEFDRFSKFFDALSHKSRLRMMKRLLMDDNLTLGFVEFIRDLGLNPKTVWEGTRKLREGGFLVKSESGKYQCSDVGQAAFLMMSLALRRLLQALEELEEF